MREFLARVKAHLRRERLFREEKEEWPVAFKEKLFFGNLKLDLTRREVAVDDRILYLKPKEFDLLLFLANHRGHVLTRDLILERVWGWEYSGGSRTVDVHVRWLREKIEEDPADPKRIVTVRGIGYRFEG
jgi:DNA-binding response OmpR family regulator